MKSMITVLFCSALKTCPADQMLRVQSRQWFINLNHWFSSIVVRQFSFENKFNSSFKKIFEAKKGNNESTGRVAVLPLRKKELFAPKSKPQAFKKTLYHPYYNFGVTLRLTDSKSFWDKIQERVEKKKTEVEYNKQKTTICNGIKRGDTQRFLPKSVIISNIVSRHCLYFYSSLKNTSSLSFVNTKNMIRIFLFLLSQKSL
jgi:HD-GYP domain-containing protein (c-di-GMP phosphodiesterase class II)